MTTLKTAAQQALEALESGALLCEVTAASILRVALESEQAQAVEPVAVVLNGHYQQRAHLDDGIVHNLYLHPAQPAEAQQVAVPDGYVLVPIEPTDAMCEAAWDGEGVDYVGEHMRIHRADLAYIRMLAAAQGIKQ